MAKRDSLDDSSDFIPIAALSDQARKPAKKRYVLVVEDSGTDYKIIEHHLREAGGVEFRVERATRFADGLKRLNEGGIDVVLLDLSLPDSSGLETVRKVHFHAPDVPIVVLTGVADESVAIDIQMEKGKAGVEYSEFWSPIRREGLFAGKPVPMGDTWISKSIRGVIVYLELHNHACRVSLQFNGEDREDRRAKVIGLFPDAEYAYELHDSPKSAMIRFPVLNKGKKNCDDWPEIREKLTSLGADIYNRIRDSDV